MLRERFFLGEVFFYRWLCFLGGGLKLRDKVAHGQRLTFKLAVRLLAHLVLDCSLSLRVALVTPAGLVFLEQDHATWMHRAALSQ